MSRRRWPTLPGLVVTPSELPPQPDVARIKVLHVITRFWAGAGGNTLLTAGGLDPERFDVWIAGCPGGPLWERADEAGLGTIPLRGFREVISPRRDLLVLLQLVRLMRRERFTIVHTHSAKGGFLGRLAAAICHVPVVVHTFHGFSHHDELSQTRQRVYRAMERFAGRRTHAFLAVAPRVAVEAVEQRLAPPGTVAVVPSAVELDAIPLGPDPSVRDELGIPAGVPVVGTVGRVDRQKAPLDFLRMAALVAERRPETRFVMVGDGPLLADARAESANLGLEVVFTGTRDDAPRIAASFDVFVIASRYEGLGRALTEALASGRPVVATAVNGVPDLVQPGRTGLLAPPGDPAALARSVLWLLAHPAEARRMGSAGRECVRRHFDPARMCALTAQTYFDLLGLPEVAVDVIDLTASEMSGSSRGDVERTSATPMPIDR